MDWVIGVASRGVIFVGMTFAATCGCGSGGSSGAAQQAGASPGAGSGGTPASGGAMTSGAGTTSAGAMTSGGTPAAAGISAGGMAGTANTGGNSTAGEAGSGGGPLSGASGSSGGTAAALCPEVPRARHASGSVLELELRLMLGSKPLVVGEENAVASGGSLTPLGLRFYISDVALVASSATAVPIDIVSANGAPAPYGVHFYNADDPSSETLRVLAPPGEYAAVTFLFGLAQRCNTLIAEANKAPLSPTSQMTWPHTGYLFLKYEGRFADASGAVTMDSAAFPSMIHMGGSLYEPLAPSVRVEGALVVPPTGSISKTLHVAMDEVFKGAMADVDLAGFVGPPGEEVVRGERLRRSMPQLRVFRFAP